MTALGQLETFPALSRMSAAGGRADEISTKADMPVGMSAVGGIADLVCQELSGPFIAEAVEEAFQPLKTERLIRLVTTCDKNESESVPPWFHCFTPPICRGFFDSLSHFRSLEICPDNRLHACIGGWTGVRCFS